MQLAPTDDRVGTLRPGGGVYFDVGAYEFDTFATVNNGVGLNNDEQSLPVMLCTVNGAWAALWPRLTHYD